MKILVLNYEFPPLGGGAGPVSYEIAKRYVGLGHSVDVVTMGYKNLPRFEARDGINIYRVRCLRSKKEICQPYEQFTFILSAILFLRKHLKNHAYDVNHTHFIIPTGIISLWLKWKYGLPYVISSHGSDVPGFNTDRFTTLHRFTRPILKIVCNQAEQIVALSGFLKNLIRQNIKTYPEDKLIKIPNGIDPEKYIPSIKENIILSTGRLLPRKGFQHLIQAVSGSDSGYEIHICGDGPMMPQLKKLASVSKTRIVFHGWINNESAEYRELLGSASIYCLLSSKENASVALLEGMSAGCAVITGNASGCPETVGTAGITIDPTNIGEIQSAINSLILQPEQLAAKMREARKKVIEEYDWNQIVEKYLNLMDKHVDSAAS